MFVMQMHLQIGKLRVIKFEYLNIPYFELLDGVEEILTSNSNG